MSRTRLTKEVGLICSICDSKIMPDFIGWAGGHNAEPVNDGRCCTSCNESIVTPVRLYEYSTGRKSSARTFFKKKGGSNA
tara:strand:- start:5001 stop:5240 length:240 start_codon:yes stop_codon:yes gene_type:complete